MARDKDYFVWCDDLKGFGVRLGNNPSEERRHKRADMTIRELCDQYIEDVSSGRYKTRFNRPKKQSTILTDIGRIETHIKPLLGNPFRFAYAVGKQSQLHLVR